MVYLSVKAPDSALSVLLQHVINIDANRIFIHQPATKIAGNGDQKATEQGQIDPLWQNNCRRFRPAQLPVKGGKRQQHHGQNGMTPGSDKSTDLTDQQQIEQSCHTGYPASNSTNTGQPQTGSGPERVVAVQKRQISSNKADKGGHRKVDQARVQRVAENNNLTGNGLHRHKRLQTGLAAHKLARRRCSVAAAGSAALVSLTGCSGAFSTLDAKGPAAADVALLWWGMCAVATLVLLGVMALWLYAIKRPGESEPRLTSYTWLWGALALPVICISALLVVGIPLGLRMVAQPDANALHINVTAHQWFWQVTYPAQELTMTDELHIPVNTPVYLHLSSADVIHSFWVPRLGVKLDMLPGRTNLLKLEASEQGTYRGQCAEYCGLGHAHMQFTVTAHDAAAFNRWLTSQVADRSGAKVVAGFAPLKERAVDD